MNDFDYEVMQKKKLARNARHKKNGSRSRYVSLPSDYEKPKKEDVKVYKLREPISYNEFRSYPVDIRKQYLEWLRDEFECATVMLAEVWELKCNTLWAYLNSYKLTGILFSRCSEKTKRRFKKWFKNGEKNESVPKTTEEVKEVEVVKEEPPKKPVEVEEPVFFNVISSCDMSLKGRASQIGQTIYKLFSDQEISVTVKFGGEKETEMAQVPVIIPVTESFVADDFGEE